VLDLGGERADSWGAWSCSGPGEVAHPMSLSRLPLFGVLIRRPSRRPFTFIRGRNVDLAPFPALPRRRSSPAARGDKQEAEGPVATTEHRICAVSREGEAPLVRDGGAHGIAPPRLHRSVVVRDLEAEWRLPRRLDSRAAEDRRGRVGSGDVQEHGFEDGCYADEQAPVERLQLTVNGLGRATTEVVGGAHASARAQPRKQQGQDGGRRGC
jgi:hypothetical protein